MISFSLSDVLDLSLCRTYWSGQGYRSGRFQDDEVSSALQETWQSLTEILDLGDLRGAVGHSSLVTQCWECTWKTLTAPRASNTSQLLEALETWREYVLVATSALLAHLLEKASGSPLEHWEHSMLEDFLREAGLKPESYAPDWLVAVARSLWGKFPAPRIPIVSRSQEETERFFALLSSLTELERNVYQGEDERGICLIFKDLNRGLLLMEQQAEIFDLKVKSE